MSIAYLVGKFGSGLAPGTVPAPAPITGHAVIRYTTLLQLNTAPGQLIPVTPVRLPIVDGVLCSATGVPSTITPIAVQATDDPLLAQSGAVFAQIDLIFDGGSEPVQVVLALPGATTVDVATAARAGGPGAVFVSGLTPAQLTELDEGVAEVEASRAAAAAAQAAAEDAADRALAVSTADLDPAAAALVAAPASQLRAKIDLLLGALAAQTASIEDLFVTPLLLATGGTLTSAGAASLPGFVAPFPLDIVSISLVSWQSTSVLASNATYWTVKARILNGVTHRTVATKTTQITDSTGAPGTEFGQRTPWSFNSGLFTSPQMVAGETMNFEFTPTGAVNTIHGPLLATIGYRPR